MIKTFMLIATLWNPTMTPAEVAQADSYVIDYNMTNDDCVTVWLELNQSLGFEIEPGVVVSSNEVMLTCQNQETISACEYEDSDNCLWSAQARGNGHGESFISWGGQIFYM